MEKTLQFNDIKDKLPEFNYFITKPLLVMMERLYCGYFHDNGWFYSYDSKDRLPLFAWKADALNLKTEENVKFVRYWTYLTDY